MRVTKVLFDPSFLKTLNEMSVMCLLEYYYEYIKLLAFFFLTINNTVEFSMFGDLTNPISIFKYLYKSSCITLLIKKKKS